MRNLHGLIQHSFALRVGRDLEPRYAQRDCIDADALLRTIFEPDGFRLGEAGMEPAPALVGGSGPWDHSALVGRRLTTIEPHSLPFKEEGGRLPGSLAWNENDCPRPERAEAGDRWEGFVIGGADRPLESAHKDFLLEGSAGSERGEGVALSRLLCQILAHRRSRLFGLPLARETVNVLLPHALLQPRRAVDGERPGWFVQPALSLFYVYGSRGFRPIFSFSLFLIPCDTSRRELPARRMSTEEIHDSVRHEWPLASAFNLRQRRAFTVSGPLGDYLAAAAGPAMDLLGLRSTGEEWVEGSGDGASVPRELTLRKFTEATLFAIALRMIEGTSDLPPERAREEIGDSVLTSLSASRVSSVVAVADNCAGAKPHGGGPDVCKEAELPRLLTRLATAISAPYRMPSRFGSGDDYRLDLDFFDTEGHAIAVVPANRCVVSVGDRCSQRGLEESTLLEAGWTAYMVIGAATATGMIRSVFRDISRSKRSNPGGIANIEREAMVELHETYDLEIMTEAFRRRYRLLRRHLGITAEFDALSDKLEALYRETSTRFEARSGRRLQLLTWATAILSAVIAVGTLVLIFKGG